MHSYDKMIIDYEKNRKIFVRKHGLHTASSTECDTCNGNKEFYCNKKGDVTAYSCVGCNEIRLI